jgi:hypothetical protein
VVSDQLEIHNGINTDQDKKDEDGTLHPDTFAQIVKNEGVEEEKQPHKNLCDPVLLRFPVDFLLNSFQVAGFVHGFSSKMCVSSKNWFVIHTILRQIWMSGFKFKYFFWSIKLDHSFSCGRGNDKEFLFEMSVLRFYIHSLPTDL